MKSNLFRSVLAISILIIGVLLAKCKQPIQPDDGGVGIIVPGKSVEGIKLGDLKEAVVAKLGRPTSVGWADGIYRSWRTFSYLDGPYAGLRIDFIDSGATYGPVDEIGAVAPYSGKTKEGIGIGSTLGMVHGVYGLPYTSLYNPAQHWAADFYCINQKKFEIHYEDSVVTTFSIGYFIPMPEDPLYPCK